MARPRLAIADHLSPDEITRRYRSCRHPVEKLRWQVLWLLTRPDEPRSADQAARLVGFTGNWVRALLKRYNAHGPDGLTDRRAANGQKPKLSAAQRGELLTALQQSPPDGGLWSGPKLQRHVQDRYGVTLSHTAAWNYFTTLGLRLKVPRPRHPKAATVTEQTDWKRRAGPTRGPTAPRSPRESRRGLGRG